ncbi:MAG: 2-amino-4-hydroxy-6-hydroxymethyldihydropteridine diphosphokinase [Thermoguttaceae bacterium]|nr:2-amino-4-hydroxy-6-hydroxymethyldihydropteridine diphosphokinase [Thermoguttaceae bacterium]
MNTENFLTQNRVQPAEKERNDGGTQCEEVECLIGFGSNLGDSAATLRRAWDVLKQQEGITGIRFSSITQTVPVGGPPGQPDYSNAVGLITTTLDPFTTLAVLQRTEQAFHRVRTVRWGPRTLDLDLLFYGDQQIDTPELTVPHSRLIWRAFVLTPAAEIAPDFRHPGTGLTLREHDCLLRFALSQFWM